MHFIKGKRIILEKEEGGEKKKDEDRKRSSYRWVFMFICIYVFIGEAHVNLSSRGLCFMSVDMEMCTLSVICYT